MKKILFLSVFVCLSAFSAFAQEVVNTTDFSGTWELDVSKSKLDERARIESMTMTVLHTNNDLKIETATKRAEGSRDAGGMNRGGGGGMMMGGGGGTLTYTLDGKESKITQETQMGAMPVSLKAKFDGDKLKLTQTRTINTQMGEMSITTKETWTLSAAGATLTVKRDTETPRGTQSSEMVFVMKENIKVVNQGAGAPTTNTQSNDKPTMPVPRTISGGVVNGRARNLVAPKYPDSARAVRASGQVSVAVTIDENGKVISANAVSGHTLLRAAAEEAARASEFNPTLLEGRPVKITGTIIYNFVP